MSETTISTVGFRWARIPHDLIDDRELAHTAIRVYASLMKRADNETGHCYPGQRRIAKEIGMSVGTVAKGLSQLEERGWITVERSFGDDGRQNVNHYYLHFDRIKTVSNSGTPVSESDTPRGKNRNGDVSKNETELEPLLTRPKELNKSEKQKNRTAMKDALIEAMGWNVNDVTKPQWGKIETAAKQPCDIGADPDQIENRAHFYRINFRGAAITPNASAPNSADLAAPRQPITSRSVEQASEAQRIRALLEDSETRQRIEASEAQGEWERRRAYAIEGGGQ